MPQLYTIPLTNLPQRFAIELSGVSYIIVSKYNPEHPGWVIDLIDEASGADLIIGLPLVAGSDLLEQFGHIGIPGKLFVYTDGDEFADPTAENLGSQASLYYYAEAV